VLPVDRLECVARPILAQPIELVDTARSPHGHPATRFVPHQLLHQPRPEGKSLRKDDHALRLAEAPALPEQPEGEPRLNIHFVQPQFAAPQGTGHATDGHFLARPHMQGPRMRGTFEQ